LAGFVKGLGVLKMTWLPPADPVRTLKLEGELRGPWVEEVRKACGPCTVPPGGAGLDLSAVTFVDAAGEALLRDLIGRGIDIVACSSYVAELLL
jgi:hypothetical protein